MGQRNEVARFTKNESLPYIAEMYKAGHTQKEIAEALNISTGTVSRRIRELEANWRESAEGEIATAMYKWYMRLEGMYSSIHEYAMNGDPRSIKLALQIYDRSSKLLGFDIAQEIARQKLMQTETTDIKIVEIMGNGDNDENDEPLNDPEDHAANVQD